MASDYIYEELGQGSNLKAPPEILQDLDQDETSLQEIGRWGSKWSINIYCNREKQTLTLLR